jgi:hypothetical protein
MYTAYASGLNTVRAITGTELNMQLVSASTNIMEVQILFCRAVRDTQSSSEPTTGVRQVWVETALEMVSTQAPTVVDEYPTRNEGFGSYWHIASRKKFIMNPGQSRSVRVKTHEGNWAPTKVSLGVNVETGGYYNNIRGRTYAIMIIMKGYPVSDSTNNTFVNVGAGKINLTWTFKMHHRVDAHSAYDRSLITNVYDSLGVVTVARQINDDDGQAMNITNV